MKTTMKSSMKKKHEPRKSYISFHIQQEILDRLFANYPFAIVGAFIIATALYIELYISNAEGPFLTKSRLTLWYLVVFLVLAARIVLYSWHNLTGNNHPNEKKVGVQKIQYRLLTILSVLTALLFGLSPSLLMPNDIAHQAYILILISGLLAGAVQSLSASYSLNIIYILFILTPTIIWQALQIMHGNFIYIGILLCMFVFFLFSVQVARRNFEAQNTNIALKSENELMIKKLQEYAVHDSLTGLFNRYYFNEFVKMEMARSSRTGTSMAFVLADIDHFKHFNDRYGHNIGDEVLRRMGHFLQRMVRSNDIACRYGGDEFVIVLVDTSYDIAKERVQELILAARDLMIEVLPNHFENIHFTVGIATFPADGNNLDEIVKIADNRMYANKPFENNRR